MCSDWVGELSGVGCLGRQEDVGGEDSRVDCVDGAWIWSAGCGSDCAGKEGIKDAAKDACVRIGDLGEEPVEAQLPSQVYDPGFGSTSDGSFGVNVLLPLDKAKPRNVWTFYTISPSGNGELRLQKN